jgi:hypothetical protein
MQAFSMAEAMKVVSSISIAFDSVGPQDCLMYLVLVH